MEWKKIKGINYEVSSTGQIRNLDTGKILRPFVGTTGYWSTRMSAKGKTFKIHRLVAKMFIPNLLNKPQINHIDGNKLNNNIENLEWCTNGENQKHAHKIGLNNNHGENQNCAKLKKNDIIKIRQMYKPVSNRKSFNDRSGDGFSQEKIAKLFGVTQTVIGDIIRGKSWASIK